MTNAQINKEINKKYGIPIRTLQDWSNRNKENWRYQLYNHLKKETL